MKRALLCVAILLATSVMHAQTTDTSQAVLDSIEAQFKMLKLKEISISAPRPIYSMTGEVVNYNVEDDPTVQGLTAFDAIRNAPTVSIDAEGNITMRGSEQVEVWLNGQPTHMNGALLQAFFESMPADAVARIEVIKNPGAQYMVADGHHILNIVLSARLRTSQLWVVGLSGNTRPYLSPWVSYVRNSDRLRFNIHLSGSHSQHSNESHGNSALLSNGDTTSHLAYTSSSASSHVFGNLFLNVDYKIDSSTTFNINSWNMLQGFYDRHTGRHSEQWDSLPQQAHYHYLDTSDSRDLIVNGFMSFELKRTLSQKRQNLRLSGTWNYLFSGMHLVDSRQIMLAEGVPAALLLTPYDRTSDRTRNRNTVSLSFSYNHPLGPRDMLTLRISGQPYGISHNSNQIAFLDPATGHYTLPDTLRNATANYITRRATAYASLRHEWSRTTLSVDLGISHEWLHIANTGLFPDDTLLRFVDLSPSLSLTHRTPSMHYLRYRYTFSQNNPTGSQLTTSRSYGTDSYSTGTRQLRSSTTHRHTLSWNKYYDRVGNISVDAYGNYTSGGIESVTLSTTEPDPWLGRIVSYELPMNIVDSYKYGLDANLTYRMAAWANLRLDGGLYREGYRAYGDQAPDWATEGLAQRNRTSWHISAGSWVKVAKMFNIDLSLNYGSPTLSLFSEQRNAFTASFSASATLLDGRLSMRIYVSDLFDSNRSQSSVNTPGYASFQSSHYSQRYITFGITYRIGKLDLQHQAHGGAASQ